MDISFTALSAHKSHDQESSKERAAKLDYPKSEPVLESSYIFPKVESNGGWKISTLGAISISTDC